MIQLPKCRAATSLNDTQPTWWRRSPLVGAMIKNAAAPRRRLLKCCPAAGAPCPRLILSDYRRQFMSWFMWNICTLPRFRNPHHSISPLKAAASLSTVFALMNKQKCPWLACLCVAAAPWPSWPGIYLFELHMSTSPLLPQQTLGPGCLRSAWHILMSG